MINRDTAIIDISTLTGGGHLVGNGAKTVTLNGKPVALEGSISTSGHAILAPEADHQVYIEGRKTARTGNSLGDGKRIQDTVPKET
jgi:uncharacterized Zn-binding protein involved in type VI secretion